MLNTIILAAASDVGRVRKRNEDSFVLLDELGAMAVADGMGAHPGGDVASRLAVQRVGEVLRTGLAESLPATRDAASRRLCEILAEAVRAAHATVRATGDEDPMLEEMGCTLTVLVAEPSHDFCCFAHVGDSRLYRFRDGTLTQLSRDHTWVQGLVDAGKLAARDARHHRLGHILTQCVGSPEPPEPQIEVEEMRGGDLYLVCSDGLVGMVDDTGISRLLERHVPSDSDTQALEAAARALVEAANEGGGMDNITVALAAIR